MTHFTVILPHRRNPGNDAALSICLSCLMANTANDFILIMDAADNQPLYPRVNAMVEQATTDCCVYMASDIFVAPGWDTPLLEAWQPDTFVTGMLVEPGAIGVFSGNITRDYGRTPQGFNRAGFEEFAACNPDPAPGSDGWPCPYMFSRSGYLAHGGLEVGLQGDPHGFTNADTELFVRWVNAGNHIRRARSYAYHLQRWSEPEEQQHEKRRL